MLKQDWKHYWQTFYNFIRLYIKRCDQDEVTMIGGYLAYISLLSLVPLIAVAFSMLGIFPMFAGFRAELEAFLYANIVPSRSDEIQAYLTEFIGNTGRMTTLGILALVGVALLLIYDIDKAINKIWRVTIRPRPIISFSIYWMILTLGPIMIGTSIAATSYVVTLSRMADNYTPGLSSFTIMLIPYLISLAGFWILYLVVPNTKVYARYAFWGALLATVLSELFKRGFTLYITHFPSYQAIYGALALVPILFVWVYLSWLAVLLGAELTALLQEEATKKVRHYNEDIT